MTCPQCGDTGIYWTATLSFPPITERSLSQRSSFHETRQRHYCHCYFGQQVAEADNSMQHPEYENPLAKMTDDEILAWMDESSKDLQAIKQEFESGG